MRLALAVCVVCVGLCGVVTTGAECDASKYLPEGHAKVPCVEAPQCDDGAATVTITELSNGLGKFPYNTSIDICHTPQGVVFTYHGLDDKYLRNDVTTCNGGIYNGEVFEAFITPHAADTGYYHESELSPQNALYISAIDNPYHNGTDMQHDLVNCSTSGIFHEAHIYREQSSWKGSISLPYSLINSPWPLAQDESPPSPTDGPITNVWRLGLYRIVMEQDVAVCHPDTCAFGAWSPTMINPPAFHYPDRFGVLVLN